MKPRLPNEVWIGALSALIFSIPLWFGIFCCVKAHATEPIANAFGDSITCGTGASIPSNAYANLIGTAMGWTINNQCYSGHELADFFPQIYGTNITDGSISFGLFGFNDMRHYGTSTEGQQSFRDELDSALVFLSVPKNKITYAQSYGCTFSSGWNKTTVYGGNMGMYSNTDGSNATCSFYGSTGYFDTIMFHSFTRGLDVSIDGQDNGTFNNANFTYPNSGVLYAPYLIRISKLSHQRHTVVFTVTDGTGYAYLNWVAGNDGNYDGNPPSLYVSGPIRTSSEGYSEGSPQWSNGNDEAVYEYNEIVRQEVWKLSKEDGLNIYYVSADSQINIATDIYGDGLHPNDSGHNHISQGFLYPINTKGKGL